MRLSKFSHATTVFPQPAKPLLKGVAEAALDCAHRTRAFSGRALREHRRSSGSIPSSVLRARRAPGHSLPLSFSGLALHKHNGPSELADLLSWRAACLVSHCARPFILSSPIQYPTKQGCEELSTAAVERGLSEGARSGSKESSSHPCAYHPNAHRCPFFSSSASASLGPQLPAV